MPVTYQCRCGQTIRAADEHAGKAVRCPGCKAVSTVPAAAAAPAPSGGTVRFACSCGQRLQVQAEHAGRTTQCPACKTSLRIPSAAAAPKPEAVTASGSRSAPARKPRPPEEAAVTRRKPPARAPEEEVEEAEWAEEEPEERPARRRRPPKKRPVWPLALLGAAAVLFLGGAVIGGVFLVRHMRNKGEVAKNPGGQTEQSTADLAFVPADAQGFVAVRPADVLKVGFVDRQFQRAKPALGGPLNEMQQEWGMGPADMERVTMVFVDAKKEDMWVVVATTKPYDRAKILQSLKGAKEAQHAGKSYHVAAGDLAPGLNKKAVHFAGDRVIVFGMEKDVQRCLNASSFKKEGPLADALQLARAGQHQVVVGANLPPAEMKELQKTMPAEVKGFAALLDAQSALMTLKVADDGITLEASGKYANEDAAKKAKNALDGAKAMAGLALPSMEAQMRKSMKPQDLKEVMDQARALIDTTEVGQQGAAATLKMKVTATALERVLPMLMGPTNPQPPRPPGLPPPGPPRLPPPPPPPR